MKIRVLIVLVVCVLVSGLTSVTFAVSRSALMDAGDAVLNSFARELDGTVTKSEIDVNGCYSGAVQLPSRTTTYSVGQSVKSVFNSLDNIEVSQSWQDDGDGWWSAIYDCTNPEQLFIVLYQPASRELSLSVTPTASDNSTQTPHNEYRQDSMIKIGRSLANHYSNVFDADFNTDTSENNKYIIKMNIPPRFSINTVGSEIQSFMEGLMPLSQTWDDDGDGWYSAIYRSKSAGMSIIYLYKIEDHRLLIMVKDEK